MLLDLSRSHGDRVFVTYLNRKRGQLVLLAFLIASLVLSQFPGIDLEISRIFYDDADDGFPLNDQRWHVWLRDGVSYFLCVSMTSLAAVLVFNKLLKRNLCGVDGRKVCYLFLVLIVGAGLIVNVTFKDNFGRARPRDIQEFGGSKQFTPAFVISRECDTNCSFSSGDAAGAFFSLALVMALSRRRAMFVASVAFGSLVSLFRIASGAHFFSDTVVSFFVMLIVADVLHHHMFSLDPRARASSAPGDL